MKVLYLLFEEMYSSSGISKKVMAQCEGLRSNGADVVLFNLKSCNGELFAVVNGIPVYSYGKTKLKYLYLMMRYKHIIKYIKDHQIDLVYTRFSRRYPLVVFLYRLIRRMRVRLFLEIPTYPYDSEKPHERFVVSVCYRLLFRIDKITRNYFKYYVDRIVTVQDYNSILGVRTIKICNGIDLNRINMRTPRPHPTINFIGVANVELWHAFDRLIYGLGNYYENGGQENIHFFIIGNNVSVKNDYIRIAQQYHIENRLHLEGPKDGKDLDAYFDKSDLAIGSLGFHRIGLEEGKPLKCVEYAVRGIPFIYSNTNLDFDDKNYTMKVPANDSPIDIEGVLLFLRNINMSTSSIRNSIGMRATWDYQMSLVLNEAKTFL